MPHKHLAKANSTKGGTNGQGRDFARLEWRGDPGEIAEVTAFFRGLGFTSMSQAVRAVCLGTMRFEPMRTGFAQLPVRVLTGGQR